MISSHAWVLDEGILQGTHAQAGAGLFLLLLCLSSLLQCSSTLSLLLTTMADASAELKSGLPIRSDTQLNICVMATHDEAQAWDISRLLQFCSLVQVPTDLQWYCMRRSETGQKAEDSRAREISRLLLCQRTAHELLHRTCLLKCSCFKVSPNPDHRFPIPAGYHVGGGCMPMPKLDTQPEADPCAQSHNSSGLDAMLEAAAKAIQSILQLAMMQHISKKKYGQVSMTQGTHAELGPEGGRGGCLFRGTGNT